MMQRDEVYAGAVLDRHRAVLKQSHEHYDGKVLQFFGDGTLSIFSSSVSAVECAVQMQMDLQNAPQVPLRIGIHTGDITYDDTGAFGDGVNVASRVERLCIPGAVYITAKVYDDIKNHAWLRAAHLGSFALRNIISNVDIYAITSKGLPAPAPEEVRQSLGLPQVELEQDEVPFRRKKNLAAVLALFLGIMGVHRFYLGQRGKGIAFLTFFIIGVALSADTDLPVILPLAILAFVESVLLFAMPRGEFDLRYNKGAKELKKVKRIRRKAESRRPTQRDYSLQSRIRRVMEGGKKKFKARRFEEAIDEFDAVIEWAPENAEAHYYLASCFSMLGDKEDAFHHLSMAVYHGFSDYHRIATDPALIYLRAQPSYDAFVANNYKKPEALPAPKPDLLDSDRFDPNILDQIELLGDQLERGELSKQEFELQKKKILRGE